MPLDTAASVTASSVHIEKITNPFAPTNTFHGLGDLHQTKSALAV